MELLKKLTTKYFQTHQNTPTPVHVNYNIGNLFLALPLEIQLLIVQRLSKFRDVLALSRSCHTLHAQSEIFLKAFTYTHYPHFTVYFKSKGNITPKEQIQKLYNWEKIKALTLPKAFVNNIAAQLCKTNILTHDIRLQSNWYTLLTAAFLGDIKTFLYLSEEEKINLRLSFYAVFSVINIAFIASSRHCYNHQMTQKLNYENFIYTLLFDWKKGKKMFQAAKDKGFSYITLKHGESIQLIKSEFLNALINSNIEILPAEQELLVGAISAGYFKVTQQLIIAWKIRPDIPAMARLFIQVTRNPPKSNWEALFKSFADKLTFKERTYLVKYFKELEQQREHYSPIQEVGYKALIPELESLLGVPITYFASQMDRINLIQNTIETGRVERLHYLIEERGMPLYWSSFTQLSWEILYEVTSDKAIEIVAKLIMMNSLSEFNKNTILTSLIKRGYLQAVINAYSFNQPDKKAFALYSQKIKKLMHNFSFRTSKRVIKQCIQNGSIDLLEFILNTTAMAKKLSTDWVLKEILSANRLDSIQWFCKAIQFKSKELSLVWKDALKYSIQQDQQILFKTSIYNLGFYSQLDFNQIADLAIKNNSTRILSYLISTKQLNNHEIFFIRCLNYLLSYPLQHSLIGKEKHANWLLLFETLLNKSTGRFDLDASCKLHQLIEKHNPPLLIDWLKLLLNLSNRMSAENPKENHLLTQESVLDLIQNKYTESYLTISDLWNLFIGWLDNQFPYFTLNNGQKSFIQAQVISYLMAQELSYVFDRNYTLGEKALNACVAIAEKLGIEDKKSRHILTTLVMRSQRYDLLQVLIDSQSTTSEELDNNYKELYIGHFLLGNSAKNFLKTAFNKEANTSFANLLKRFN